MKNSYLTVTDQFCGAGGSSLGAASLGMEVKLALNHWQLAIDTHNTNFPDTIHDCADVSATDPRRYFPTDILITSPECTNHSVAKGVRRRQRQMKLFGDNQVDPAAERSRATMWDVPRFAEYHDYNMIITENVVDARAWVMWDAWIMAMAALGYDHHIVYHNSMFAHLDPALVTGPDDFSPQSRDRMYVVFWKRGNKRPDLEFRPKGYCPRCEKQVEAVQTWKNTPTIRQFGGRWGRYGAASDQYLYTCKDCLWQIHKRYGSSLSNRHLVEAEVVPYYFAAFNAIDWSLEAERIGDRERPLKPKTMKRIRQGLEKYGNQYMLVQLAHSHAMNNRAASMRDPMFAQTTAQTVGMVAPYIINTLHGENGRSVTEPMQTQTARQSLGLVWGVPQETRGEFGFAQAPFVVEFKNNKAASSLGDSLSTILAGGFHHGLMLPAAFLSSYYGTGGDTFIADPMGTVSTVDRHALVHLPFLLGYANQEGPPKTAVEPLRTLHTENGQAVVIPSEPPAVDDCYFRMLQPHEIGRGMAFPDHYVVLGSKRDQVKQYGNAVTPPVMKMILERCVAAF